MAKMTEKQLQAQADELEKQTRLIDERQAALTAKEAELTKWGQDLSAREDALAKRERALDAPAPQNSEALSEADNALIKAGLDAYGIDPMYVLNAGIDRATGRAVILTRGGCKVRYAEGDDVAPLDAVRIDGEVRRKMKPVTGK